MTLLKASVVKTSKILQFQVVSPIHIGTREGKLSATDFVFHQGKIYLINEDRFGELLREKRLIDEFVNTAGSGPLNIQRFLSDRSKLKVDDILPRIAGRIISGGEQNMQDFRPFVRDGFGNVFIPATSLKGVFRTAILYRMLMRNDNMRQEIETKASEIPSQLNDYKKKKFSHDWLQKEHLQKFYLPGGKIGPNEDILRCLKIRDAYPIGPVETRVIKLKFLSKSKDGKYYWSQKKGQVVGDLNLLIEAVTAGTFRIELSWDQQLFDEFKKNNLKKTMPVVGLDDLLSAVQEMNNDLWAYEKDFYEAKIALPKGVTAKDILRSTASVDDDASRAANMLKEWYSKLSGSMLRVGFGSGMLSTTVNLAFSEYTRQKIRDVCGDPRRGDPAPKSRRVWLDANGQCLPMGWFKIVK